MFVGSVNFSFVVGFVNVGSKSIEHIKTHMQKSLEFDILEINRA